MARDYMAEGRRAFGRGVPSLLNPYRYGSPSALWQAGHAEAWCATPEGQQVSRLANEAAERRMKRSA